MDWLRTQCMRRRSEDAMNVSDVIAGRRVYPNKHTISPGSALYPSRANTIGVIYIHVTDSVACTGQIQGGEIEVDYHGNRYWAALSGLDVVPYTPPVPSPSPSPSPFPVILYPSAGEVWRYTRDDGEWCEFKVISAYMHEVFDYSARYNPSSPKGYQLARATYQSPRWALSPRTNCSSTVGPAKSEGEYRAFMLIPPGECVCGIKRSTCDYHKQ